MKISGTFEVTLQPQPSYTPGTAGITLGRMSIDKTFAGDLTAISKGEMLNALSPVAGSAGYVAIEQVTGQLQGKTGSFVLQHYGTMQGVAKHLRIEVVPDSGLGELQGLTGTMQIRIEQGQHYYDFDYHLPAR